MLAIALALAGVAALIHVYIFVLESLRWTTESTRRTFGTSASDAETTQALAFNQGFYNLFLAIVTVVGIVLLAIPIAGAGVALFIAGTGSMALAALVLFASNRRMLRAALIQGTAPALALLALLFAGVQG